MSALDDLTDADLEHDPISDIDLDTDVLYLLDDSNKVDHHYLNTWWPKKDTDPVDVDEMISTPWPCIDNCNTKSVIGRGSKENSIFNNPFIYCADSSLWAYAPRYRFPKVELGLFDLRLSQNGYRAVLDFLNFLHKLHEHPLYLSYDFYHLSGFKISHKYVEFCESVIREMFFDVVLSENDLKNSISKTVTFSELKKQFRYNFKGTATETTTTDFEGLDISKIIIHIFTIKDKTIYISNIPYLKGEIVNRLGKPSVRPDDSESVIYFGYRDN